MSRLATKIASGSPVAGKAAGLTALIPLSDAAWREWSFSTAAREGYGGNPYVYRGIKCIADSLSSLPIYAMKRTSVDDEQESRQFGDGHPMQKLVTHPNGQQSWPEFALEAVIHLTLAGEVFMLSGDVGEPSVRLLRPDRVTVIHGRRRGEVMRYDYSGDDESTSYSPDRVGHLRLLNPLDDWRGMSPLSPAAKSVDLNNASRTFHKALFDNGAVGGVVITSTEGATEAELDVTRQQIRARKSGAIKAGETWFLPSTQKMEKAAWSPRDSMSPEVHVMSLREVAVALGVDPALLGDSTSKIYSNMREARAALYIDSVLPLAGLLLGALARMFQPRYPGVFFVVDKDQIEELSESQDGLWARAQAGAGGAPLVTPNEARDLIGYDRIVNEDGSPTWADRYYAGGAGGLVPVESLFAVPAEEPAAAPVAPAATAASVLPATLSEPASNTALNGAHVASAVDVVQRVAAGDLPRESGVAILVTFFNLTTEQAESIMGEVGRTFFVAPPDALADVEGVMHDATLGKARPTARTRALDRLSSRGARVLKRLLESVVAEARADAEKLLGDN